MIVTLIRHAESTGNAGMATVGPSVIELTENGVSQAEELANTWTESPTLIVISPYLRTKLTAQPTIERFPQVPVEEWPVQEFTYLDPVRWRGTTMAERLPAVESFWKSGDPAYRDSSATECFSDLLRRAEGLLGRLAKLPANSRVLIFTHGQFMQAVRLTLLMPKETDAAKLNTFRAFDNKYPLSNCAFFSLTDVCNSVAWRPDDASS